MTHVCLHCRETCSCESPEDCRHDCDPVEQDETASHGESCVCSKCEDDHDEDEARQALDEVWAADASEQEADETDDWRTGE